MARASALTALLNKCCAATARHIRQIGICVYNKLHLHVTQPHTQEHTHLHLSVFMALRHTYHLTWQCLHCTITKCKVCLTWCSNVIRYNKMYTNTCNLIQLPWSDPRTGGAEIIRSRWAIIVGFRQLTYICRDASHAS